MNEEKDFEFKDEEIDKIAADLNKQGRRKFGENFENASIEAAAQKSSETSPEEKPEPDSPSGSSDSTDSPPKPEETSFGVIKPLRTYERDMAETIRNNNESVASINLKQQQRLEEIAKKGGAVQKTEKVAQKSLTFLISLVLVIAGTGIIALIYYFASTRPPEVVPAAPSIITTNETRTTDITGLDGEMVLAELKRIMTVPTTVGNLVKVEMTEGVAENKKVVTAGIFFELIAKNAPPALGRAFGQEWAFGFLGTKKNTLTPSPSPTVGTTTEPSASVETTVNEPFIFVSVDSFENAFDGMIKWEKFMADDLFGVFVKEKIVYQSIRADDSSPFDDKIIRSKDVRVQRDLSGNIVLLYSFLDPENLVITTSEQAFTEILNRFYTSRIVR